MKTLKKFTFEIVLSITTISFIVLIVLIVNEATLYGNL